MQRSLTSVSPNTTLKEVARLIFSLSISGIPVVENDKIIGLITESDVLKHLQPKSKKELANLGEKLQPILDMPVKEAMNKNFISVSGDKSIAEAQSLMFEKNVSRLPVIDKNGKLLGIISQGDIFNELIKSEMPQIEQEKYVDYVAKYYDKMVEWEKRFDYELPVIFRQLRKLEAESVIDLGSWTGEYSINLIKEGMKKVIAFDHNESMIKISNKKINRLNAKDRKNIEFKLTDFKNLEQLTTEKYDAAVCMGNSLPYIPLVFPELLSQVKNILRDENGAIILQVLNQEKLLNKKDRLLSFQVQKSEDGNDEELFLEFFDTTDDPLKVIHNLVIFERKGTGWNFKGTTSIPIFYYTQKYLEEQLYEHGFKRIIIAGNQGEYQGEYGQLSFHETFDKDTSDWINIVAVKR